MDPLEFLLGLDVLGMKFGLENMRLLCGALGHPDRAFRSVIVAGTNGKGSTTAMVSAALHAAGHRVARYTSPHLTRLEERFVIGEAEVDTASLRQAAEEIQRAVEQLLSRGQLDAPPTFFECTTAVAFRLFERAEVEVAVLEVGLGGRLDATNVVTPVAAAITSIGLDHQAQLGTTLAEVAREKAGVIKPDVPVVAGPLPMEAEAVIVQVAHEQNARLVRLGHEIHVTSEVLNDETVATIETPRRRLRRVPLALAGRHQAQNAAVAVAVLDELEQRGFRAPDDAVAEGLSGARWPARLERFRFGGCDVLLDAAHNPDGALTLAAHLREIGWRDVILVFGAMRDKDIAGMLHPLLPLCARIICTTAPGRRAASAAELTHTARAPGTEAVVESIEDPAAALERACALGGPVVVAGSIFLAGPLRGILR